MRWINESVKGTKLGGGVILLMSLGLVCRVSSAETRKIQTPTVKQPVAAPTSVQPVLKKTTVPEVKVTPLKKKFVILPDITYISPLGCFIAGDKVTVAGKNFGVTQGNRDLILKPSQGGSIKINNPSWHNDKIAFNVPLGVPHNDIGKIGLYEDKKTLDEEVFLLCTEEHTMPQSSPNSPSGLRMKSSSPASASPAANSTASSLKGRMNASSKSKMLTKSPGKDIWGTNGTGMESVKPGQPVGHKTVVIPMSTALKPVVVPGAEKGGFGEKSSLRMKPLLPGQQAPGYRKTGEPLGGETAGFGSKAMAQQSAGQMDVDGTSIKKPTGIKAGPVEKRTPSSEFGAMVTKGAPTMALNRPHVTLLSLLPRGSVAISVEASAPILP